MPSRRDFVRRTLGAIAAAVAAPAARHLPAVAACPSSPPVPPAPPAADVAFRVIDLTGPYRFTRTMIEDATITFDPAKTLLEGIVITEA